MFGFGKKRKKKSNGSIYLTFGEFKKLANERNIDKKEQFLINYYKQLSNKRGINEKEASHALNCIVTGTNDTDSTANDLNIRNNAAINNNNHNSEDMYNNQNKIIDMTNTKTLNKFIEYVSDKNQTKFVFLKLLTNCNNNSNNKHMHLDINSIGIFIYELVIDFLKNKCLCKPHQIPSYNYLLSFLTSIKSQLSYFNDNRHIFSLGFITEYLPLIVTKFNQNKDEIKHENTLLDMELLTERMGNINETIKEYQNDISDIIDDLKFRSNKLKSNTYPEQIDELNNMLNDLRKQIEILAEDLTKVENEQLSAERSAEELRDKTLQKLNIQHIEDRSRQDSFNININQHIQNVMDENMNNILGGSNINNERRGSQSQSQSQSQSKSVSHTIDSHMASTSIRKPFFVRPLGFDVDLDVDKNELFVSNVTLNSQAYKLKVCRGWRIAMVGREDRVSVMYNILSDANQQTNDDDNALPLFITFQVSSLKL